MTIRFSIHFNTKWGEELFITGSSPLLGNHDITNAFKLNYAGNAVWEGELKINSLKERLLSYKYFVKSEDGSIYYESGKERTLALNSATKEIAAYDQWQGNTTDAPFLSAPFSDVFFTHNNAPYTQTHQHTNELIIRVTIPNVPATSQVCICGNTKNTGEWREEKAVPMTRVEGLKWEADFNIEKKDGKLLEYKFLIKDNTSGKYTWEEGENRKTLLPKILKNNTIIIEHSAADFHTINPKFAGVSIPVFSLRTKNSHGVGDFGDLKLLIDWAKKAGLSIIQLLPINDTSSQLNWRDSYPYNCISTLALHPIYINLEAIGTLKASGTAKQFQKDGKLLNHTVFLDYEEVWEYKMHYLRALYEQEWENTEAEPGYYTFLKQNKEWLQPYANFCVLRDKYKTADFRAWKEHSAFNPNPADEKECAFYLFIQYHLHKQMSEVKAYAHANGVALKGDIPIGISRNSVDAWQFPHLFNFNQQAGAPPDFFSQQGQNWGFPTYNWEEMEKDNYTWWRTRLTHFANYFDAYRIDHILGFFRIWELPIQYTDGSFGHFHPALPLTPQEIEQWGLAGINYTGLFIEDPYQNGKFHPMICSNTGSQYNSLSNEQKESFNKLHHYYFHQRHNNLWYKGAMRKLQQLIASTNMLTCGEDLGMLNDSVTQCMRNLKILSLEMQQISKTPGTEYSNPQDYPYLSVCTTSTHDCETLRMWLGKQNNEYSDMIGENGEQYYDAHPASCLKNLEQNLASPSMLAIFPLQDWLSIDGRLRNKYASSERINNPSNPEHYWRYRMHLTIEDLLEADDFNCILKEMIHKSRF